MIVGQLMSIGVRSCHAADTLDVPTKMMWDHDCGCVPVVDPDGCVAGMITDRDVCMAAFTKAKPISQIVVGDVMTTRVVSCKPEDTIALAEHLMRQARVHRLPVVDDAGKLVGILSLNDLALAAAGERRTVAQPSSLDRVAGTLAAICEHRAAH